VPKPRLLLFLLPSHTYRAEAFIEAARHLAIHVLCLDHGPVKRARSLITVKQQRHAPLFFTAVTRAFG